MDTKYDAPAAPLPRKLLLGLALSIAPALLASQSHGAIDDLLGSFSSELEERAAVAALETYSRLIRDAGCTDGLLGDPRDLPVVNVDEGNRSDADIITNLPDLNAVNGDSSQCTGQTFTLFANVREIIHTANEITGDGPTAFSLGSNLEGLGFALRWTAGEEFAAQGSLSSEFSGSQVSGLATRLSALRAGASGFSFAGVPYATDRDGQLAYHPSARKRGAGASGDGGQNYSRLGGFINYEYGEGTRDATDLEDAFDFDSRQITLGLDYRFSDQWVAGAVVGISDQEVDFDASKSIVEGGIEAEGYSIMPFAMFQGDKFYASGSLGYQQLTFDSERAIRYPSFNPDLPSTDTVAVSETDADVVSLFTEVGYTYTHRKITIEPFANLKYSDTTIDGFVEDDITDDAFDLVVEGQEITSTELTLGVKLQYTFTPSFGVFVPYVIIETVNQSDDAPRFISAYYAQDTTAEASFNVPTDKLDSRYNTYAIGVSSVIRGARQKSVGGVVGGDIQGFFTYKVIEQLEGYDIDIYSFGLRYTF